MTLSQNNGYQNLDELFEIAASCRFERVTACSRYDGQRAILPQEARMQGTHCQSFTLTSTGEFVQTSAGTTVLMSKEFGALRESLDVLFLFLQRGV